MYQRFIITRNIAYGNKIFTFLKLNKFDKFYKKKLVAYLVSWIFEHWLVLQHFWYCLLKIYSCYILVSTTNKSFLSVRRRALNGFEMSRSGKKRNRE